MMGKNTQDKMRILVYGIDNFGYEILHDIEGASWSLIFEDFNTQEKFQDYDGIILFQGTFEYWSGLISSWAHYHDELLKREKQLALLKEKKGLIAFLLVRAFFDRIGDEDRRDTDLAKRELNYSRFYRSDYKSEVTRLEVARDELRPFLRHYGSAISYFENLNEYLNLKPICYCGKQLTGFILNNTEFFLPSLKPEKDSNALIEYFTLLADNLVSCYKKLSQELPNWVNTYLFKKEEELLKEKNELIKKVDKIDEAVQPFNEYKKCLCFDGEFLKESVICILEDGFGFKIDPEDEFREDLKIVNENGEPFVLVEVKGTSRGVTREMINQADNHRERNNHPQEFPSISIVNTNIKKASSIDDKYQDVAEEQIKHAVKMNVLVLRTIDLLNLLYLKEAGAIDSTHLLNLFVKEHGWLKTTQEGFEVLKETE